MNEVFTVNQIFENEDGDKNYCLLRVYRNRVDAVEYMHEKEEENPGEQFRIVPEKVW